MSDHMVDHLAYFEVYKREVKSRENMLAKVAAYRELVDAAGECAAHKEFVTLPPDVRSEIAKAILEGQAWLLEWKEYQEDRGQTSGVVAMHNRQEVMRNQYELVKEVGKLIDAKNQLAEEVDHEPSSRLRGLFSRITSGVQQ